MLNVSSEYSFNLTTSFQRAHHVEPCLFNVDITSIRPRPNFDNFQVISAYFFNVISMIEKPTSFPRTFYDVILLVKKSTLFPCTFFDVISMVENSTLLPRTFLDVISTAEKSTLFPRIFFKVISMGEICTLFLLTFFDVILIGKNLTSFLVSCKLMKTFEKVFPEFVTLNSWLLQDCSL